MGKEYKYLNAGDRIQREDEYSTSLGIWKTVPEFLVGDIVPDSVVHWRRIDHSVADNDEKKKWYSFLFRR